MAWFGTAIGALLIFAMLLDVFEAMILPRRVRHSYRLARLYYQSAWALWRATARLLPPGRKRHGFLSVFGPLSLFVLMGIWAIGLIIGFVILNWSIGTPLSFPHGTDDYFTTRLYFSGTTFFTLGYGDIVPTDDLGRMLSVVEAGVGFGFLAIVISYLPVLYNAFSRREIAISLLDARAGSPPSAGELLRRMADGRNWSSVSPLLIEWERWAAEVLESHISYPVLSFYRSQHDNQSWVGTLTIILDTTALLIAGFDDGNNYQARLTFAMARHAAVDLGLIFQTPPQLLQSDRLPAADLDRLQKSLRERGVEMRDEAKTAKTLEKLRGLYEPFVNALANHFQFSLPHFQPQKPPVDNWQTSAWTPSTPGLEKLPVTEETGVGDDHFG